MFTGIVRGVGRIAGIEARDGDVGLQIDTSGVDLGSVAVGDSIAVDGVCLTAVATSERGFVADVSRETLDCTALGELATGAEVNLEPALRAGEPLGGHLVSGHVDGVGELVDRREDACSVRMRFALPAGLSPFIAPKGSITIDGISLTVNTVEAAQLSVNIVPHTLNATNLGALAVGGRVNVEVDLIARYVARLMQQRDGGGAGYGA